MVNAGLLVGRYRLVERLGYGSASAVWRGYDEVLRRAVAVKLLDYGSATDAAARKRVRIEATALARVPHPNLTRVYDYGELDRPDGARQSFVVTELVEGTSLDDLLAGDPLPWRTGLRICAEVAGALAAAHNAGVAHRDIDAVNVIVTDVGVKLVDFGGAGGALTPAQDMYALGALIRQVLTVCAPPPTVARELNHLCDRCLGDQPSQRPGSPEVAVLLAAAVAATGGRVIASVPVAAAATASDADAVRPATPPVSAAPLPAFEFDDWGLADLLGPPTLILPVSPAGPVIGTASVSTVRVDRRAPRSTARRGARALRAGAVAGAVAAAVVAAVAAPRLNSVAGDAGWVAAGTGAAGPCAVHYQTSHDAAGAFAVDLTLSQPVNAGAPPWTLTFAFPGDQRLIRLAGGDWSQAGRVVTVRRTASASPVTMRLTGTYRGDNPLPTTFILDGATCTASVAGAAGDAAITALAPRPPGPRLDRPGGPTTTDLAKDLMVGGLTGWRDGGPVQTAGTSAGQTGTRVNTATAGGPVVKPDPTTTVAWPASTPTPTPKPTQDPGPTATPKPTGTPKATRTSTPLPSRTPRPMQTPTVKPPTSHPTTQQPTTAGNPTVAGNPVTTAPVAPAAAAGTALADG